MASVGLEPSALTCTALLAALARVPDYDDDFDAAAAADNDRRAPRAAAAARDRRRVPSSGGGGLSVADGADVASFSSLPFAAATPPVATRTTTAQRARVAERVVAVLRGMREVCNRRVTAMTRIVLSDGMREVCHEATMRLETAPRAGWGRGGRLGTTRAVPHRGGNRTQ